MRLNVDIKQDIYDEFAELVKEDGRSIGDTVRSLLIEWIEQRQISKARIMKTKIEMLQDKENLEQRVRRLG